MSPEALHEELLALAGEAGLRVRKAGRTPDPDLPLSSGVCRLRGEIWVVLADGDSLAERVDTLVLALRTHAGSFLESRFLAPALRELLEDPTQGA